MKKYSLTDMWFACAITAIVMFVTGMFVQRNWGEPPKKNLNQPQAVATSTAWFRDYLSGSGQKLKYLKPIAYSYSKESDTYFLAVKINTGHSGDVQFLIPLKNGWHVNGVPQIIQNH